MKQTKLILSSILSIVLCTSLIVGASFALFTSEQNVNIAITSGTVNVTATAELVGLYSPTLINLDGTIQNADNAATTTFKNGGTAELVGNTLALTNMTPGDKATIKVTITNNSTVDYMQHLSFGCTDADKAFFNELLVGTSDTVDGTYIYFTNAATPWVPGSATDSPAEMVMYFTFELPSYVSDWQNKTANINLNVIAVQGNAAVTGDEAYNMLTVVNDADELNAAVAAAQDGDTIVLGAGLANADLTVAYTDAKELTFRGYKLGTLTVDAPNGTVNVYNDATALVGKAVAANSLHVFGEVATLEINEGRVVVENAAKIENLVVNAAAEKAVAVVVSATAETVVGNVEVASKDATATVTLTLPAAQSLTVADTVNADEIIIQPSIATAEALRTALANAKDGDVITLTGDVYYPETWTTLEDRVVVTANNVTLDLGAYTINIPASLEPSDNWMGINVSGGSLTVNATTGGLQSVAATVCGVYGFNVEGNGALTINGGIYDCGLTVAQAKLGTVTVNGGIFMVESVNSDYGNTYLFNCVDTPYREGTADIIVNGGTFRGWDPANSKSENPVANFLADGYVTLTEEKDGDTWYTVGTLTDMLATAKDGAVITLSSDLAIAENGQGVSGKANVHNWVTTDVTLDLNGYTLSFAEVTGSVTGVPILLGAKNGATLTIKNGTLDTEAIKGSAYCVMIIENSTVIVESGTFYGAPTAIQATAGTLIVNGGFFALTESCDQADPALARYLINCLDRNFNSGIANIVVTGGTFVNCDPSASSSESTQPYNFLADGYTVETVTQDNGDIWYTVVAE